MSLTPLPASIVVPTYREQPNVRPLTERLFAALEPTARPVELIFVDDDSQDGTEETVADLARRYPVRLIVRKHQRGLSSAVLVGLAEAAHGLLVVLDADLQHPPEMVPVLLDRLEKENCDFVLATRYAGGGGLDESWPWWRRLASRGAAWLARPLVAVSDPMSGFFALRRCTLERAAPLDPVGYKIALELMVKSRCRCAAEVPIRFALRQGGTSKFGLRPQLLYLAHLARLYRFRFGPAGPIAALVVLAVVVGITLSWLC